MDTSSTDTATSSESVEQVETTEGQPQTEAQAEAQALKEYLDEQAMGKFVKVKVDGQEIEVPLAEALKDYQLKKASYKKMEEASHEKQRALKLLELAEKDPFEMLKLLGKDPRGLTEEYLAKQLEEELMSEDEKRLRDERRELEEFRAEKKRREEEAKQRQLQEEELKVSQQLDAELTQAFQSASLPKHKFFVQQVAATMLDAAKQGVDLSPKEAVGRVEKAFSSYLPEILQTLPREKLVELVGSGARKKLREFELEQIGAKKSDSKGPAKAASKEDDLPWHLKNRKQPMSEKEYRQWRESMNSKE